MWILSLCVMLGSSAFAQVMTAPPTPGVRIVEGFTPHRATYDLSLKSSSWSANVVGVQGRMVSEFDDVCAGYTYNQRLVTNMMGSDGKAMNGNYWISTYESADGSGFRFSMSNTVNGQPVDKTEGSATRQKDGPAKVSFQGPKGKTIELPAATLFPTEFMGRAVLAAKSGQKKFSAAMFEGDGQGKVYDAYVAIGRERRANDAELAVPGGDVLKGLTAWPVTVSYYVIGEAGDLPDYETSFLLFENGMTAEVSFDYGDFSMAATLKRIDGARKTGC